MREIFSIWQTILLDTFIHLHIDESSNSFLLAVLFSERSHTNMKRRLLVFAVFVCLLCRVSSVFVQQYSGRQEVGDWATKDATHAGPLLSAHFPDLHYLPLWSAGMCALCCRSCIRKLRRRWSWRSSCGLCGDHTLRWLAHSCSSSGLHTLHMVNMVHMVSTQCTW